MKRLILFRHAAAAAGSPTGRDIDRPLTDEGRDQARAQGRWLATRPFAVARVLCSPAIRATETAAAAGLPEPVKVEGIYAATVGELVRILEPHMGSETLCVVGHNPGISGLARFLTDRRVAMTTGHLVGVHFDDLPPGALQPGVGEVFLHRSPRPV